MVKANVDRILDILKEKKSVSINELAGKLSLPKTDVEKSAEYLEEDGVVKIDHKFPNTYVTLVEKSKKEDGKKEEKAEASEPVQEEPKQSEIPQPSPPPMPLPEKKGPSVDVAAPGMPPPPPPEQTSTETPSPAPQSPEQPKPEPNLPQEEFQQPGPSSQPSLVEEKPKEDKKPSKTPFLIDEPSDTEKKPDLAENVSASLNVMQQSPVQEIPQAKPDFNQNPIEPEQPKFDMAPPTPQATTSNIAPDTRMQPQLPESNLQQPQQEKQPSQFGPQEEFAPKKEFTFPDYADTDVEKLEYLMEQAHDKLTNKEFQDINVLYRAIYGMFTKSQDLSPNERHLLSERIQELFQRIKRLYLIEGVTV